MSILYKGLILLLLSGCVDTAHVNIGYIKNMLENHDYYCGLNKRDKAIALHEYNQHIRGGTIYLTCKDEPNSEILKDILEAGEGTHL